MDIFNLIELLGGLAFFLFGMKTMSGGLERLAGGKLETTVKRLTDKTAKGFLVGLLLTIALQSSSAAVVMMVGLVNSGVMQFGQTIGVMLGSNIGTTFTSWMLSLVGIDGGPIAGLFSSGAFSLLFALAGVVLLMLPERKKSRDIGTVFIGFALLIYGMSEMSGSVAALPQEAWFMRALSVIENPALGLLVATLLAALMQSSAAAVGIVQALSFTGTITLSVAIPLVAGANVGTCITVLVSSIGASKDAKRVAAAHIGFNAIGAVICLVPLYLSRAYFGDILSATPAGTVGIAITHTVFNVIVVVISLFIKEPLIKLVKLLVKDKELAGESVIFDERLLKTPAIAVSECIRAESEMLSYAKDAVSSSIKLIRHFDRSELLKTEQYEKLTDRYEDILGSTLVALGEKDLTENNSMRVTMMLHALGDIERIADHALNIARAAEQRHAQREHFSEDTLTDIDVLTTAVLEILSLTLCAMETDNPVPARQVEPLEQVIDKLTFDAKARHIDKLQVGSSNINLGMTLAELIYDVERISDHCSNIAVCVVRLTNGTLSDHAYTQQLKSGSEDFKREYDGYSRKYRFADRTEAAGSDLGIGETL